MNSMNYIRKVRKEPEGILDSVEDIPKEETSQYETLRNDIETFIDVGELEDLKKTIQVTYDDGDLSREEYNKLFVKVIRKIEGREENE